MNLRWIITIMKDNKNKGNIDLSKIDLSALGNLGRENEFDSTFNLVFRKGDFEDGKIQELMNKFEFDKVEVNESLNENDGIIKTLLENNCETTFIIDYRYLLNYELIEEMLKQYKAGYKMVRVRKNHTGFIAMLNNLFFHVYNFFVKKFIGGNDLQIISNLQIIDKSLVEVYKLFPQKNVFFREFNTTTAVSNYTILVGEDFKNYVPKRKIKPTNLILGISLMTIGITSIFLAIFLKNINIDIILYLLIIFIGATLSGFVILSKYLLDKRTKLEYLLPNFIKDENNNLENKDNNLTNDLKENVAKDENVKVKQNVNVNEVKETSKVSENNTSVEESLLTNKLVDNKDTKVESLKIEKNNDNDNQTYLNNKAIDNKTEDIDEKDEIDRKEDVKDNNIDEKVQKTKDKKRNNKKSKNKRQK
jgi:hypothetical protein